MDQTGPAVDGRHVTQAPAVTHKALPAELRALRQADVPGLLTELGPVLAAAYPGGQDYLEAACSAFLHPRLNSAQSTDIAIAVAADGTPAAVALTRAKGARVKLCTLWVTRAERGRGLGTALVSRAVAAYGARPMYLTCDSGHAAGFTALLTPHGFVHTASLPGRYAPGRTEIVFTRPANPEPAIRALSLTRPWADLVLCAGKTVENRTWSTRYRGVVVLHGAKSTTDLAEHFCAARRLPAPPSAVDCSTGYLGLAHLVANDCSWEECGGRCSAWAMPGSRHWQLRHPVPFLEPIPGRGQVGLWTPPTEVLAAASALLV